jgi:hypothetical protein
MSFKQTPYNGHPCCHHQWVIKVLAHESKGGLYSPQLF